MVTLSQIQIKDYTPIKQVGKYKCELKSFKVIDGHDDSLPYIGKLYINGKYVCKVMNDGWGGMSFIREMNDRKLYEELGNMIKGIVSFSFDNKDYFYNSVEDFCDDLACKTATFKEIKKHSKNHIVLELGNGTVVRYKMPYSISMLVNQANEQLVNYLTQKMNVEDKLLNTNLRIENNHLLFV